MSGDMNKSDDQVNWMQLLEKGLLTGAIAGMAGALMFGTDNIVIMGKSVPGVLPMAVGAAAGSMVGDLAHMYILPQIPHNQKYEKMESATISVAAAAAGTYVASSLFGPVQVVPSLALGAGSYVAADWAYANYIGQANAILF